MFNIKFLIICVILIYSVFACTGLYTENEEDDRAEIIIKQLFSDLNNIKSTLNGLNTRMTEDYEINKTKHSDLPMFDIRVDEFPSKCKTEDIPKNCAEATSCTFRNGIYKIKVKEYSNEPFLVECDVKTEDGDWIIIQRRQDGSVNFIRDWESYKGGFGYIEGEFFIGLDKLYALTNHNGPQELLIIMEDKDGNSRYAKYNTFVIGNETELYELQQLGKYSGTAGDSLHYHIGMKFSTKERDNDKNNQINCALTRKGAWWYNSCHQSNLNGEYGNNESSNGINWKSFRGFTESLKYVKMMIRRKRN